MKITVSVPPDIYDRLKYAAWSSSSSKGAVVTAALAQALPKVPNTLADQQPSLPIPDDTTTHTIGFIPLRKGGLVGHGVCSCGGWRSSKTGSREATQSWGKLHSRRKTN